MTDKLFGVFPVQPIKWWEHLILLFVKPRFSVDNPYTEGGILYKVWHNKIYIIKDLEWIKRKSSNGN